MSSVDNNFNRGSAPGGASKKINVSFGESETESSDAGRMLEDIVDEELASEANDEERSDGVLSDDLTVPEQKHEEEFVREPEKVVEDHDIDKKPVRVSKRKSGNGLIAFLIILIILIAGGFFAYYLLSTQTIKNDLFAGNDAKCEAPKVEQGEKKETISELEDEKAVIEVVEKIKKKIIDYKNNKDGVIYGDRMVAMNYDYEDVLYKINDETMAGLEKSYGLYITSNNWIDDEELLNVVSDALSEMKFVDYAEGVFEQKFYINNELNIVCSQRGSCASLNWRSEDNEILAKQLAEAYKKKEGNPINVIFADIDDIKGEYESYDSIVVSFGTFVGFFYRYYLMPGPVADDWIYVTGTQDGPNCAEFDEEARTAFKGNGTCIDFSEDPAGVRVDF